MKIFTFRKSIVTESEDGNFKSKGVNCCGIGNITPWKKSLFLKACIWRGIKSPTVHLIRNNWSTSDFPGHKASPRKSSASTQPEKMKPATNLMKICVRYHTYSPDIYRCTVLSVANEQLWRSVPSCGYIIGIIFSWIYIKATKENF